MKKIVVIGSLNMDLVVNVQKMPLVGETILAEELSLVPGGKGANQAFAAGRLGAEVTMLGAVGNDAYGEALCQSLRSAGVCVEHLLHCDGVSTGTALITVNAEGDNSIVVVQGANKQVDRAYLDSKLALLEACDIVILQLEIPLDTVVYGAQKAKALGKLVILDPAPAQPRLPAQLLACVDLIKPNETELAILLGTEAPVQDLKEGARQIQQRGVANVLVTLGGEGAYLYDQDGREQRFHAPHVQVVDTTAAGDSFTAGVAVSLAKGSSLPQAIAFANRVAALVVTRKGAQSSIPSLEEVEAFQ